MRNKLSKSETNEKINSFFLNIKDKSPEEVRKIKKFAASYNIKLGKFRKTFCKKCLSPYIKPRIRINKGVKRIKCNICGEISRWKINHS